MIHRLALLMGGAGAAGVLGLALAMNSSAPPQTTTDAFVPVANDVSAGDHLAQLAPTDQPASPAGDGAAPSTKKVVDTIYVLAAPRPAVGHTDKPVDRPAATQRPSRNGGDDGTGDDENDSGATSDDQTGDRHADGGHSDDGGSRDREPGDD